MKSNSRGENIWAWACRACAVGTLVYLIGWVGFDKTPTWGFILLIGLFFGPDAIKGNISFIGSESRRNGNGNGKSK